jgi:UPF0716 protein FxsA
MNVAKWLLFALLALPLAELTAFIVVAANVGFLAAVALQALCSFAGVTILRHAGGAHISRIRTALDQGRVTALSADGTGSLTLLGGILLLIPGFITDAIGVVVLVVAALRPRAQPASSDGVIDLPPEQWHQIDDPRLADRRDETPER